jgi:hypothetical protein
MQFVTIGVFRFPTDPDFILFTTALEQANIDYFCPEENQLSVDPILSIGLGGLRVMVNVGDEAQAKALYAEIIDGYEAQPDEAEDEIARMKAEDEKMLARNYRTCLFAVGFILVFLLAIWFYFRGHD